MTIDGNTIIWSILAVAFIVVVGVGLYYIRPGNSP